MQIQCPNCKTIIAKGFDELAMVPIDFTFYMRCHKCQSNCEFVIRSRVEHKVIMRGDRNDDNRVYGTMKTVQSPPHPSRRATDGDDDTRVFVSD